MFGANEDEIMETFQRDVLCGLDLSIKYRQIFDDASNSMPGYSFIHDSRNPFHKYKRMFLDAIIASPKLYEQFIVSNDGVHVQWNTHTLRQWLLAYSKLQRLRLVRMNMTMGFPCNGIDLKDMLLANTDTHTLRHCVVYGSHITIPYTHFRNSIPSKEKCVPYSLDAFSSDILIQDFSITRPFAELAAGIIYDQNPNIIRLYRTQLFVNQDRLFNFDDLILGLQTLTLTHLDVKLGVRKWKQVKNAFLSNVCTHMYLLQEDEPERVSNSTLQSGHSRLYGVTLDALFVSQDLLPLLLEAGTQWQITCSVVPGGLGIPYTDARIVHFKDLVEQGKIKSLECAPINTL